ncbi:endonuclease/exonuclease/phosphatase family metal-dependent hydrolase [Haloactinopolyspora alba]|uniref:Endonuclease/exonuclease/phosphatase family metal-dependent hydrolase n=1 Tax=Haloactinopolyspora alba TaxID=648780 RepID=A0A2P8E7F1_9ACTN|nr:endonuclease/exonuclease/phosphatase family protein [Haloactinopolyspora alba]PSL05405.1 endonuclease/exonuclease/phosphatase family metal-dependent hydrolase [Haloactinopolyspora alba]
MSAPPALRFATFNIRNGRAFDGFDSWPLRRGATAAAVAALDADVLGLQEVYQFQRRFLARRLPGLRWHGRGRDGGRSGEQCPVAVAHERVAVTESRTRWYGDEPDQPGTRLPGASFPRIATLLRCRDTATATEFQVANTHLDERVDANRASSVRQLAGWLDLSVPTVVLGDFNTTPGAAALRPLTEAGLRLAPVTGGTSHGFTGRTDGRRIDHVYLSAHWTLVDAAVVHERPGGRLPSDHWPVRVIAHL